MEGLLSPNELYDALLPSTPTLVDLTCVSNPAISELDIFEATQSKFTPAFDRLLPHFLRLERLCGFFVPFRYRIIS